MCIRDRVMAGQLDEAGVSRINKALGIDTDQWRLIVVDVRQVESSSYVDAYAIERDHAGYDDIETLVTSGDPIAVVHVAQRHQNLHHSTEPPMPDPDGPLTIWDFLAGTIKRMHLRLSIPQLEHHHASIHVTRSIATTHPADPH